MIPVTSSLFESDGKGYMHAGWLYKYSIGKHKLSFHNWRRRYFVTFPDALRYFDREVSAVSVMGGAIDLKVWEPYQKGEIGWLQITQLFNPLTSSMHPEAKGNEGFYFGMRVVTGKKECVLCLRSETEIQRLLWIKVFEQHTFCSGPNAFTSIVEEATDEEDDDADEPRVGACKRMRADRQDPSMSGSANANGGVSNAVLQRVKQLVSKNKKRFQEENFDLDLSYITPHVIAMGYPSEGREAYYRNGYPDVMEFLTKFHDGKYKIYNLCSERYYEQHHFQGRFARYPWDDHNAPPLDILPELCEDIDTWIRGEPNRIVCIHCKAGKGRTGVAVVAYLLYSGVCQTLQEAHSIFNEKRTKDGKGVQVPSQRRYLTYIDRVFRSEFGEKRALPPVKPIIMRRIILHTTPHFDLDGGCDPYFLVMMRTRNHKHKFLGTFQGEVKKPLVVVYDSREHGAVQHLVAQRKIELTFEGPEVRVYDDVRIEFLDQDTLSKDDTMFEFWMHTSFAPDSGHLTIPKSELDSATKDKNCVLFDREFAVTVEYEVCPTLNRKAVMTGAVSVTGTPGTAGPLTPLSPGRGSGGGQSVQFPPASTPMVSSLLSTPVLSRISSTGGNESVSAPVFSSSSAAVDKKERIPL